MRPARSAVRYRHSGVAVASFDVQGARKEGYSDAEIAEYLAKQNRFNLSGARKEGYSDTEIVDHLSKAPAAPTKPLKIGAEGFGEAFSKVAEENPIGARLAAGATTLRNMYEGAKQLAGHEDKQAIEAQKILEQKHPGAALAGGIATFALPGGGTLRGATAIGAASGFLNPAGSMKERAVNTVVGGAAGAAGGALGKGVEKVTGKFLQKSTEKAAAAASKASPRVETIKAAQAEGYVIPPSATGGGKVAKTLESVGGKAATAQEASIRNQQVTNQIARREAGLAEDEPITEGSLAKARDRLAQPYKEIAAVSPRAKQALEKLQDARLDAKDAWKKYGGPSGGPEERRAAMAADNRVAVLERLIDREAKAVGRNDLLPALKQARIDLAKNHDVEAALNLGTGDVDARVIGRILDRRGEKAVTGGLQTVGKFAQAFAPFTSPKASGQSAPGVGYLRPYTPYLLGAAGLGATEQLEGRPYGIVAGALPLLSGPARAAALSRMMQRAPEFSSSLTLRGANTALPAVTRAVPLGVAAEGAGLE